MHSLKKIASRKPLSREFLQEFPDFFISKIPNEFKGLRNLRKEVGEDIFYRSGDS